MPHSCPACNSNNIRILNTYRTSSNLLSNRNKAICLTCDLIYMNPMPSKHEWVDYNKNYFKRAHGGVAVSSRARAYHRALAKIRVNYVLDFLIRKNLSVKTVFEAGPGYGEFAEYWMQQNPVNKYIALETDSTLHSRLKGLNIHLINNSSKGVEDDIPVDLVIMSHVLEHTLDPVGFIKSMTARLKSGGILFIEVPCQDFKYKNEDEPHVLFFDKTPMKKVLEKSLFLESHFSYHGEEQELLISKNKETKIKKIVSKSISELSSRLTSPSKRCSVVRNLSKDEWIAVAPFKAHVTSEKTARWLRVLAVKR